MKSPRSFFKAVSLFLILFLASQWGKWESGDEKLPDYSLKYG